MEYKFIKFEGIPEDEFVDISTLEAFISNAKIIISTYGLAWSKSFIKKVGNSTRGAALYFKDGTFTYGYNIDSKIIKANNE